MKTVQRSEILSSEVFTANDLQWLNSMGIKQGEIINLIRAESAYCRALEGRIIALAINEERWRKLAMCSVPMVAILLFAIGMILEVHA